MQIIKQFDFFSALNYTLIKELQALTGYPAKRYKTKKLREQI
jgi:hypothetical protein